MAAVYFVPRLGAELLVHRRQQIVADLDGVPAGAADDVMMAVRGGLIDEPAIANVRYQRQSVLCQEVERAIDGRFRKAGHARACALEDLLGRQVTAIIF